MNHPLVSTSSAPRRPWARRLRVALAAPLLALSAAASAAPTTYYFGGNVGSASGTLATLAGRSFSGRLLYDPAAAVSYTGVNFQDFVAPDAAIAFSIAGDSTSSGAGVHEVITDVSLWFPLRGDVLRTYTHTAGGSGVLAGNIFLSLYQNIDLHVLASLDLPAALLDLDDPRLIRMGFVMSTVTDTYAGAGYVDAAVSCLGTRLGDCGSGTPVPEPGTLALVAAGLIAARRRRASF
jgi:hypothetical protein